MQSTDLEEIKAALWEQAYVYTGTLGSSTGDGGEKKPWTIAGPSSWTGALASGGRRDHRTTQAVPNRRMRSRRGNRINNQEGANADTAILHRSYSVSMENMNEAIDFAESVGRLLAEGVSQDPTGGRVLTERETTLSH